MDRYWELRASSTPPAVPSSSASGYPADGNPAVGVLGTVPGAWWYHLITEEIRNTLVAFGVTPDFTQTSQLSTAIVTALAKLAQSIPPPQVNADWDATSGPAQILHKPSLSATLPCMTVGLNAFGSAGGTAPSAGLIDQGSWYQVDFNKNVSLYNGFSLTPNANGTAQIEPGLYAVIGGARICNYAYANDTYQLPAQVIFAVGEVLDYGFPGIYQYAIQCYPDYPITTQSCGEFIGSVNVAGFRDTWASSPLWMGYSKVLGAVNSNPLTLQGGIAIVKVG